MITIHERIKERREAAGLTLAQVAELVGVKDATVQRWESGDIKTIKYDTVEALAEVFHCTPQYLVGWEDANAQNAPTETDERAKMFVELFNRLTDDQKDIVLAQLEGIVAKL